MTYKESGVEWIGQVPINWNTLSVSKAYKVTLGKMLQPNLNDESDVRVPYLKAMNVQDGYLSLDKIEEMYCSLNELKTLNLEVGDLVVCEGGEVARSAIIKDKLNGFIFQNSVHRVKGSEKGNIRFLHYLLVTLRASGFINILVNKATIAHFTKDKFNSLKIALPSLNEQLVISNYLDIKCNEVEKLIESKKKLIHLLEKQRQSIITEAVTKGLNPNVKMKDSGVEWIGKMPEHWIKTKFKYITNKIIDGTHSTPNYIENGVPFLRVTDITQSKGKAINLENVKYISEEEHYELVKRCNPEKGDLLVSKNGTIGIPKVITWDWEFSIFVSLCLIKLKQDRVNPHFASYFFESDLVEEQIAFGTKKSTIMNLHLEKVKEFFVFLPPLEEQLQVIEYLNEKAGEYSNLIDIQKGQIEKLKEYRQSLIYEAVTGKIDVRDLELDKVR